MSLFIETHIIQNFAPSNLNRDDTGAPKDAIFGGYRRARISSQCLKKSVRNLFLGKGATEALLAPEQRGLRTKKLGDLIAAALPDSHRAGEEAAKDAKARVANALASVGLALDENGQSQYLVFLGHGAVSQLARIVEEYWDELAPVASDGKKSKKESKAALPKVVQQAVLKALDGDRAVDVALFGRMLADLPAANTDGACQVAHAISTHKVDREFDYFTAMDDMATPDESGAAMIETTEFNAACLYRYANIDLAQLRKNLGGDEELVRVALAAYLRATVLAIPTGKQNAFAAHNPPEFVGVAVRHGAPRNLCNAFQLPLRPRRDVSLSCMSASALAEYEAKLATIYGKGDWAWFDATGGCPKKFGTPVESLEALVTWLLSQNL